MDRATVRQNFNRLISQPRIEAEDGSWHSAAYRDVESRLGGDAGFPCVFSKNAFRKQLLKFLFVEDVEAEGMQHLAEGLKEYVEVSREWDNTLDTAYPLVVIFSRDAIANQTVEGYHAFGWKILQKLHEIDDAPWPEEVAIDPDSPGWAMCFDGMPLFCNMSSPAHQVRRSRNLGAHFVLVIGPGAQSHQYLRIRAFATIFDRAALFTEGRDSPRSGLESRPLR